ncbi:unnamed protein product [Cylicostephanus goldi]|uniref:Uncharacterized protein n=1 Tax=Cylicostephanus goldi TaxID=71465 RepID=A0A3P6S1K6_CYLGO|nr:unnamed protein product [Cylicostephanus goldi]
MGTVCTLAYVGGPLARPESLSTLPNDASKLNRHPLHTVDDVLTNVNNLRDADPKVEGKQEIADHQHIRRLFRYNCLPINVNSVPEFFNSW